MDYIKQYFSELYSILLEMSPWLLFGFLIAGILHVFFPDGKINNILGKSNMKSVFRAALIGVPLPLCSCGVIPTGISIYKNGASKGAAVSFLISTPQTGVDSIMVTYSMLGLPFAIIRPIVAFLTGIFGGAFTNMAFRNEKISPEKASEKGNEKTKIKNKFTEIFRYAFVDFLQDIAKWLIIGLLIAAFIAVVIPNDFFATHIQNDFLGMLVILAISLPLYVCATSSIPIAAVLLMKGISPGAALVFLMAGPASNAATIAVIGKSMGKKTLFIYLGTLVVGALFSGIFIDYFLPREWFAHTMSAHNHNHELLPEWLSIAAGVITIALLINIYAKKIFKKKSVVEPVKSFDMSSIQIFVRGMNCNHCKMSVENSLLKLEGVEGVSVDLANEAATLKGSNIDLAKVKSAVESIGYRYEGPNK